MIYSNENEVNGDLCRFQDVSEKAEEKSLIMVIGRGMRIHVVYVD